MAFFCTIIPELCKGGGNMRSVVRNKLLSQKLLAFSACALILCAMLAGSGSPAFGGVMQTPTPIPQDRPPENLTAWNFQDLHNPDLPSILQRVDEENSPDFYRVDPAWEIDEIEFCMSIGVLGQPIIIRSSEVLEINTCSMEKRSTQD